MLDNIKKKLLNELLLISKVEELVAEITQRHGCYYIEDPGWNPAEDSPQFQMTITRVPYNVKDAAMELDGTYIETRAWFFIEIHTDDEIIFKDGHYMVNTPEGHTYRIDEWDSKYKMLIKLDFYVNPYMVDKYGMGDAEDKNDAEFEILVYLNENYEIGTIITNEYNDPDRNDFFNEVIDLDEPDEDYERTIIDPNLPRIELVKWFSSILNSVDKVFGTKYERFDNDYSFIDISYNELRQRRDDDNN